MFSICGSKHWRKNRAHGEVMVVRYQDDIVVGFNSKADAGLVSADFLRNRMEKYKNLDLRAGNPATRSLVRMRSTNRDDVEKGNRRRSILALRISA